jgi:hypothetical protein
MKHLLPLLIFLASCGPSRYLECPKYVGIAIDTIPVVVATSSSSNPIMITSGTASWQLPVIGTPSTNKTDTLCEWMHVSMRDVGFVMARKALSVRVDGICSKHLDCSGKPFPAHYKVGWCEGKEELLNRLVKGRAGR